MAGIANEDFSDFSLGSDIIVDGSFEGDGSDWALGSGWSVNETTDKLEHDGVAASNTTQDSPGLTAYRSWKIMTDVDAMPGGNLILRNTIWEDNVTLMIAAGQVDWRANIGDTADRYSIRCTNTDVSTTIVDNLILQEVTLDDWTLIGDTRSQTEFVEINGDDTTVRLVSASGKTIGYEQACDNGTYLITPNVTVTEGTFAVSDGDTNTVTGLTGNTPFNLVIENGKFQWYTESGAAADILFTEMSVNAYPVADITNPADSTTAAYGEEISFEGTGTDVEDVSITGAGLVWTSSINGLLGTGSPLTKNSLSGGTHTITLTVTDSDSNIGTDEIEITVEDPENTFESNYFRKLYPRGEHVNPSRDS